MLIRHGVEEAERLGDLEVLWRLALDLEVEDVVAASSAVAGSFGERSGFVAMWPSLTASVRIPQSGTSEFFTVDSLRRDFSFSFM